MERASAAKQVMVASQRATSKTLNLILSFSFGFSETVYKLLFSHSINSTTKPLLQLLFLRRRTTASSLLCEWTCWMLLKKKTTPIELELFFLVIVSRM